MKNLVSPLVSGVVAAGLTLAVVSGPPALAGVHLKAAAKNSVTSKSIKNATIQTKDLNSGINASLGKANTALQSVPDNSVTTSKLANGAVTAPKLAGDSVGSANVINNSLRISDLAASSGATTIDVPNLPVDGACFASAAIPTGRVVTGDFILVREPAGIAGNIEFYGREDPGNTSAIDVVACNNGNSAFDPPSASYTWAVLAH